MLLIIAWLCGLKFWPSLLWYLVLLAFSVEDVSAQIIAILIVLLFFSNWSRG